MVGIATCCWCMGQGFGEVCVPLFSRAMGPGVGGLGGIMGTGCGSSSSLKGEYVMRWGWSTSEYGEVRPEWLEDMFQWCGLSVDGVR